MSEEPIHVHAFLSDTSVQSPSDENSAKHFTTYADDREDSTEMVGVPELSEEGATHSQVRMRSSSKEKLVHLSPARTASTRRSQKSPSTGAHRPTPSIIDDQASYQTLTNLRKEVSMQDKIIDTLHQDNEALLNEKRSFVHRNKHLEDALANLEAKHSLLLSAYETDAKRGESTSSITNATINSLKATVSKLQHALDDSESAKMKALERIEQLTQEKGQLQDTEAEIQRLRSELREKETESQAAIEEIAKKVSLYVDNQEYSKVQEELIKGHEETIRELRVQVSDLQSSRGSQNASAVTRSRTGDKKDRQIHLLNKRIVELEDTLRREHPDSIAELIRSCQPSAQDSQLFKKQEARIRQLEQALEEKDKCTEAAVAQLRVETEKLRSQYEKRISHLQAQMSERGDGIAMATRTKQLEKELLELRRSIGNKPSDVGGNTESNRVANGDVNRVSALLEEVTTLTSKNERLEAVLRDQKSTSSVAVQLQSQIAILTEELTVYKRMSSEGQAMLREAHERWDQRLAQAKQEFIAKLHITRQEHNSEINRLQKLHNAELRDASERRERTVHGSTLWQKVTDITDSETRDSFLLIVVDRLNYIEKQYVQREKETAYELAEVKRIASFELSLQAQKTELLLEQKNQQINEFRFQLDQLITGMATLQSSSLPLHPRS